MADHNRIDPARIGMLGFSFGANWSTRMAALDHRLKAVVSNGGLYHRSFSPAGTLGMSEIMLTTLASTVGAKNSLDLGRKLSALSVKGLYSNIRIPLLVINGAHDTLASTQDSADLAEAVPGAELKLYPNDDHCAMGRCTEWPEYSTAWLLDRMA